LRLDVSQPDKVSLADVDGRLVTGVWTVSTDNKRLILSALIPMLSNAGRIIEYYILTYSDGSTLTLERTAESRKTGNTINHYDRIPM